MVLETVQSLKNRIIFKMNGQSQSGLPNLKQTEIQIGIYRTTKKGYILWKED